MMFSLGVPLIVLLGAANGLNFTGQPSYFLDIPMEGREYSMCRTETIEQAIADMRSGDETFCPGFVQFLDLLLIPTDQYAINNFIDVLMNHSVYGQVIENFTDKTEFSDAGRLLKNIWFDGEDSLFKRVFLNYKHRNVIRLTGFVTYLYNTIISPSPVIYHSVSHKGCKNETEVSEAACFFKAKATSVVYLPDVNPLFDMTVFTVAAMMGKLIENKTTQENLTFVVRHPDDQDCLVPLTVLYKEFQNDPPVYLTYKNIKTIYYDYQGKDGKTNMDVCDPEMHKITHDSHDEEYYVYQGDYYDNEDTNSTAKKDTWQLALDEWV